MKAINKTKISWASSIKIDKEVFDVKTKDTRIFTNKNKDMFVCMVRDVKDWKKIIGYHSSLYEDCKEAVKCFIKNRYFPDNYTFNKKQ